jgi:hypothetical protein
MKGLERRSFTYPVNLAGMSNVSVHHSVQLHSLKVCRQQKDEEQKTVSSPTAKPPPFAKDPGSDPGVKVSSILLFEGVIMSLTRSAAFTTWDGK